MTDKEAVHHLDEILEMAATSDATTEKQDDALRYAITRLTNKPEQRLIRAVVAGLDYNPGHSDLDDEQPVHVRMTLGDYRLACRLQAAPSYKVTFLAEDGVRTTLGAQGVLTREAAERIAAENNLDDPSAQCLVERVWE